MADHARFTLATEAKVHFCDPQSPWQRGSNENTNGPLPPAQGHRSVGLFAVHAERDRTATQRTSKKDSQSWKQHWTHTISLPSTRSSPLVVVTAPLVRMAAEMSGASPRGENESLVGQFTRCLGIGARVLVEFKNRLTQGDHLRNRKNCPAARDHV